MESESTKKLPNWMFKKGDKISSFHVYWTTKWALQGIYQTKIKKKVSIREKIY